MDSTSFVLNTDYLVFIKCNTFNHSNYIVEALNSFSSQRTSFPYACLIIDDCSTDGEQRIIQEWIEKECDQDAITHYEQDLSHLIIAKHKINSNCTLAFHFLKQNLYGDIRKESLVEPWRIHCKYEAICEGDDYWTDSNKLQEQIDFLELNVNCSATSSNSLVLRSTNTAMKPFGSSITKDYHQLKEILVHRQFHTASVVFRISAMRNFPDYRKGRWDTFMWCCLLTQGPIHYEGKETCVYRKQLQGVTETTRGIEWIKRTTNWADIIIDCFVPKYVQRRYVVRSITREIVEVAFIRNVWSNRENREQLKKLYRHNFSWWNLTNDFKEVIKQCAKKVIRRKTPNSGYYQ